MKIEEIYEAEPRLQDAVYKFCNMIPLNVPAIRVLESIIETAYLVGQQQTLMQELNEQRRQTRP